MTDQTRAVISQRRSELSAEQRAIGWDYVYWIEDNCIWGAYFCPDGTVVEIEFLQRLFK